MNYQISELREKINPIRELFSEYSALALSVEDELVAYLEVKFQLLLAYCINVCFYLALKCEGVSVKAHPVMKQLLELRYAIEKVRPLDGRLKHQIDRLINVANMSTEERNTLGLRPNPSAFADNDEEDEGEGYVSDSETEIGSSEKRSVSEGRGTGVYRAPRISAAPYQLDETREEKEARKQQRKKNKLKNSAIYESLQEEFGITPELASSSGIDRTGGDDRALQTEIDERENFEEDRFVRLTMTRKDKKALKLKEAQSRRLDRLTDLGDIGGIDEFDDLKVVLSLFNPFLVILSCTIYFNMKSIVSPDYNGTFHNSNLQFDCSG